MPDRTGKVKEVEVSFRRVECRELAQTVGPVPLCLEWEVLGVMVRSVNEHEAFRAPLRTNRKEDFLQ
jgi:hypothetical protein